MGEPQKELGYRSPGMPDTTVQTRFGNTKLRSLVTPVLSSYAVRHI